MRAIDLFVFSLCLSVVAGAGAAASEWKTGDLPASVDEVEFVAIGSDGLLYEVSSNANGYVFESLQDQYRFEPTGQFSGNILVGRTTVYLGSSCDSAGDGVSGRWTKDGTGLNFAIENAGGVLKSYRVLSDGLQPGHSC